MFERVRGMKASSPETIGAVLVLIGLVLFLVIFLVVYPALSDPVGTYDRWFPESEEPAAAAEPAAEEEETPAEPVAAFRFVTEAIVSEVPVEEVEEGAEPEERSATYRVTLEDRSEPGDAEIVSWTWELGDGREARGALVNRTYEGPGVYPVRLSIEDANGLESEVEGDVEVPEEGVISGRIEAEEALDLTGIESAIEDAVVALEGSIDDTLDSVGSTARSSGVVALFALAAIATTVVAWRVTRSGVMLLRPNQRMRLKVKSADMHVDVAGAPLEETLPDVSGDDGQTKEELDSRLVEV